VRITLDSTVLVRAHQLATGPARALFLALLEKGHRLVLSPSILEEVDRVLRYPRLVKQFGLTDGDIAQYVAFLAASSEITPLGESLAAPIRDPNDLHVLQTAISGGVEYLCTLDEDFKETLVVSYCANRGVTVISDLDLLRLVRQPTSEGESNE